MRRAVTLAAAAAAVLTGCAQAAPPLPAALPSASSVTSASATPSATPTAGASTSATGSGTPAGGVSTPTVAPKTLATLKLPGTFGAYQASTTTGTGEQQVVYVNPADANDTLNIVVTGLADATTIASAYTKPALRGPAICGSVSSNSTTVASCALPLDKGAIVVTGSGTQTIDVVSTATTALWAALA